MFFVSIRAIVTEDRVKGTQAWEKEFLLNLMGMCKEICLQVKS